MRIQIVPAAVAVTLVLTCAATLTGGAALAQDRRPTAPHHSAGHPHAARPHVTVVEHAITDTTTDTGASGDSVGDVLTFANPIFTEDNRTRIGHDNGFCIRTKAGAAYECTWTTFLRHGSLTVSGPFYDTRDSVLAITGGTARYAGARGTMLLHARNAAGSAYDFTFRLGA